MNMRSQHHLDMFDELLAQHRPFGDSDYLNAQLRVRYKHRLGKVSALLPVAGELLRALDQATVDAQYRVVGDPVVRHTIEQALRHAARRTTQDSLPLADCEEIFRGTLRHLQEGKSGGPLEAGLAGVSRLGNDPRNGWVWSEEHDDDAFGRCFRSIIRDNFVGEGPCTPTAVELERLGKGADLLGALLPLSGRSALSHTHVLVVFRHVGKLMPKASCSEFRVGGTIFMNREMLENPWWVAEHLFHEALHQKLYDFRHTHSLLARDTSAELNASTEAPVAVYSIWNAGGAGRTNYWDTFRAVAAFHVYVHLALLCLQAERRKTELVKQFGPPDGSFPSIIHWHKAFERAQYLGRQLKDTSWKELGQAGQLLVDWLISVLDKIDAAPPPRESFFIDLLLERYVIEAAMLSNRTLSPELETELLKIIDDEAQTIRSVLSALDQERPNVERLDDAVARRSDESAEVVFMRFRSIVARTLRGLSPDGYGLRGPSSADTIVQERMVQAMAERSTRQLIPLLDGAP